MDEQRRFARKPELIIARARAHPASQRYGILLTPCSASSLVAFSGSIPPVRRANAAVSLDRCTYKKPWAGSDAAACSRAPLNRRRVAQRVSKALIQATVSRVRILFPPPGNLLPRPIIHESRRRS